MGNFPQFDILCIFFTNVNILTIIDKNRSVSAFFTFDGKTVISVFLCNPKSNHFRLKLLLNITVAFFLFLYDNISVIIIERKCMF